MLDGRNTQRPVSLPGEDMFTQSYTDILLECVDAVLPIIWAMCNASLREGFLPTSYKEAIITPVLKKPRLDSDVPKNSYRSLLHLQAD